MINNFDDFCLWMYVIVDDIWQEIVPYFKRPGPEPICSDSELLTMALVGECRGWNMETELLSHWYEHQDLFPHIPSQSRFNRRRRHLQDAFQLIYQFAVRTQKTGFLLFIPRIRSVVRLSDVVAILGWHHRYFI